MSINLPQFSLNDNSYYLVYSLTNNFGFAYDSSVFTFASTTRKLTVYTSLISKSSDYSFIITAKLNIPVNYAV